MYSFQGISSGSSTLIEDKDFKKKYLQPVSDIGSALDNIKNINKYRLSSKKLFGKKFQR